MIGRTRIRNGGATRRRACVMLAVLGWLGLSIALAEPSRFDLAGRSAAAAEWLDTDGERIVFGSGLRVHVARDEPSALVVLRELTLDRPATSGVLLGDRLFVVEEQRRLRVLDLDARETRISPLDLTPAPRGRLRLARMGRLLLVAEDGYGVRVIDVLPRHGQAGPHDGAPALHGPRTVGRFETSARITAITAVPRRFYVATDEYVAEVDARDPRRPAPVRIVRVATPVRALAANGSNLYVLGLDGLRVLSLAAFASSAGGEVHPALRGSSMVLAGRTLRIAAGSAGIVSWRDATPRAQLHPVSVENNFFSPASVTIDVGDWIQWTNSAGFHNVFSCNPGQTGCAGSSSTETFTSGPPAPPLWEYSYQFTLPGPNPYICQSHATTMAGLVTVSGASASPPVVPDGTNGTPMRVSKLDPSGATLSVSWDTSSCTGAADHEILYGVGSRLPNTPGGLYWLQGAQCSLGLDSPYAWSGVPDPSIDETRLLWWLVVATDAVDTEGPWGADSTGIERSGIGTNGSSNRCGITDKDLGNPCGSR